MIISHRHRFIFLKTMKTAGTSVELFLRQFCGPDDVVTPVVPDDERLAAEMGVGGPRNYGRPKKPWEFETGDLRRAVRKRSWPLAEIHFRHQCAIEVRKIVGDDTWNSYHRITIVRDPWEQFVSRFFWVTRDEVRGASSIDDHFDEIIGITNNWEIYTIDDEIAATRVLRYETLEDDLRRLCADLGLRTRFDLPRAKSNVRPRSSEPERILSQAQIDRIGVVARREIETFGYGPPRPA